MPIDAWLPIKFITPGGETIHVALYEGNNWQIYNCKGDVRVLIAKADLAQKWMSSSLVDSRFLNEFSFGKDNLYELSCGINHILMPIAECKPPDTKNEALAFAEALRETRRIDKDSSLHDAIFFERLSRLLPTYTLSPRVGDDIICGAWLTGGVPVSINSFRRLSTLVGWLGVSHLEEVIKKAGFEVQENNVPLESIKPSAKDAGHDEHISTKHFILTGRPELERFINEHVIDIVENEARYKALGIDFPSAIIFHGPPGCGKTFAVERLVDYLGWPSFQIEASSVASPYIHETSKKVAEVFDKAINNAPSVLVIDEMEAFLADRQAGGSTNHYRVEEVAEFLRRIPEAIKNHVLIFAMTNRIEMIDPGILRRGRFDHVVKVDMASENEVHTLLERLISDLPHSDDIDVKPLAKHLSGRPLSDVTFIVREGARLAAREGKDKINQESLLKALGETTVRDGKDGTSSGRIGFI